MSEDETPVIRVKNLEKIYTGGVHAVKGVSFDVLPKKVVVIIGSSGSGKSTVLRCINNSNDWKTIPISERISLILVEGELI